MAFTIKPIVLGTNNEGTRYPDCRTRVERMFFDWDYMTGKKIPLPIRVEDCSYGDHKSFEVEMQDCIGVLLNFKGKVAEFNGPTKGRDFLLLGGCRQGRGALGGFMVPLDEVGRFNELTMMVLEAYQKINT